MSILNCLIVFSLLFVGTSSWSFPTFQSCNMKFDNFAMKRNIKRIISTSIVTLGIFSSLSVENSLADSRLNAPTAAGTRVNSDPESLLRYGLPIDNKEIREVQVAVENIKADLKGRRVPFAISDVGTVKRLLSSYNVRIVSAAPKNHQSKIIESLSRMSNLLGPLENSLQQESSTSSGSLQERAFLDEAFERQDVLAKELSVAEQLLVPDDFKRTIPEEYSNLPALQGRAEVEFVIKKPDGSAYDVQGKLYDEVKIKMVIDGYNAPLTGGNFVDLVNKGFYKNKKITRSDGFVVQTGDSDPNGSVHGYVPPGSDAERTIPLEISLKGDKELLYGITSEDDGRGYAAAVLPFQSYGALGMARSEYEPDSASSQFFWLLFESDLTPAGKNLLDGRYSCFGYTVDGADLLQGVKVDDVIASTKVLSGGEKLVVPK